VAADALTGIKRLGSEVFDVIYADPPYDYPGYDDLLMTIDRNLQLAPGAVVAIEHRRNSKPFTARLDRLVPARTAGYGEVSITLFKENDDEWN
jgi:16S rRNA G966 N2-methylase RsmD